jgi:outer membrane receptor protein involved in Fe transport
MESRSALQYVNVVLKNQADSSLVSGTISDSAGFFTLLNASPGKYLVEYTLDGYDVQSKPLYIGNLSEYLDLGVIEMISNTTELKGVSVSTKKEEVKSSLDKKTFTVEKNISQSGGSILQAVQNLPGVTMQDGKIFIRGSDKVMVLIDGRQTALTGFGGQVSLDNIPASAIERIEIINNPSAKYDANGNAGIINIILRKNSKEGFNGKVGISTGLGALWIKRNNLPGIRPQFRATPKFNPSLSLNYRRKSLNIFFQGDIFYNPTLNKNEFVTRVYDSGEVIRQQTKRNRNTTVSTARLGIDKSIGKNDMLTVSGLYSREKILDNGDEPFFNGDLTERKRLWQFLEDEVKTTVTAVTSYQHKFRQYGHLLNIGLNYTFHREDEKYFFTNYMPSFTGYDAFKLLSDEHVMDFTLDYIKPLKYGHLEAGVKYRWRDIPTNMQFIPGLNSPLDTNAGGWAVYKEKIPAVYGNYIYENKKFELESGLRLEFVDVRYQVDPNHNTYSSNGYRYFQPFGNIRLAYKMNTRSRVSFFYNRRVDRPNEFDIRVFPKYDDAEIVKVGNPALKPQFTNSFELGYKTSRKKGYLYAALYHKMAKGTITRIGSTVPPATIIYSIMQNAGKSYNTGVEVLFSMDASKIFTFSVNLNAYNNRIEAFSVENKYPRANIYEAEAQQLYSWNAKFNGMFYPARSWTIQLTAIYLAPDLIPQGKIGQRFSLDFGMKKIMQKGKGEVFINASDLLNTMVVRKEIHGAGFMYYSNDYYETQVIRLGYSYKF